MNQVMSISGVRTGSEHFLDNALGVLGGVGFTFALFFAIATFEDSGEVKQLDEIEELRVMSIPLDSPPARPVQAIQETGQPMPLTGIEIAVSDSPVKIAVMAPDLAALLPETEVAPSAVISPEYFYTGFKPQIDTGAGDFDRVFQQSEVDQRPSVLARPNPFVPPSVRGKAKTLRVSFLIVVSAKGSVDSVRLLVSSGNPAFDEIVMDDVREAWVFQPAVRKGRKVRCLLQQAVRVSWTPGSPFEY